MQEYHPNLATSNDTYLNLYHLYLSKSQNLALFEMSILPESAQTPQKSDNKRHILYYETEMFYFLIIHSL